LSFAPQPSFVKYPNAEGQVTNYEATSNCQISDQWYQDNMFISKQAIKSGIYLDTFNQKQVLADCILDLAVNKLNQKVYIIKCLTNCEFLFSSQVKTICGGVSRNEN